MVAYQCGNAANIAPPAVMSQTSLPSHTGPMVESMTRLRVRPPRPPLSRPSTGNSAPTPKSNPSRTKYPDHNTAMRTNQTVDNSIVLPLFGSSYPLRDQYVKTNGSSSARSLGSNERPSYGSGPARAYRIGNRIAMTAKTPYRTVNRLIDIKTSAVVVPGDTPVRVVISPNTSHGWRPISVNIQPKELASSGKKATVT